MPATKQLHKILIVDDEWESPIVKAVRRRLEEEGWRTIAVEPDSGWLSADEFEVTALHALEVDQPDGVLLDVHFWEHKDDRFKGLGILRKIIKHYPKLPILMFTQYAQGPDREMAVSGTLKWDAPVDFIDKLASPEEVVLRLRRLIGIMPEVIAVGRRIFLDVSTKIVYVNGHFTSPVADIRGIKFEILRDLVGTWVT